MSRKDNRLTPGYQPLSYQGVRPNSSILIFSNNRAPTINDKKFHIGTLWINTLLDDTWILVDLSAGIATWLLLASSSLEVIEFICNHGSAYAASGILNLIGDDNFTTTATGSTVTINLTNGTNGQLYIGSSTGPTALRNLTAGTGIIITEGVNSISIEDTGGGGISQISGDTGTALPVLSNIRILAGSNITTAATGNHVDASLNANVTLTGTVEVVAFSSGVLMVDSLGAVSSTNGANGEVLIGKDFDMPAWNQITSPTGSIIITHPTANSINLENAGSVGITSFITDVGTATAAGAPLNINVLGGTNINTSATGYRLTINLNTNVTLSGTLTLPWTNGVLLTDGTGEVSSSNGANGEVLIGGVSYPVWNDITSSTLTITKGANSIEIADNSTSLEDSLFNLSTISDDYWYHLCVWKNVTPDHNTKIMDNGSFSGHSYFTAPTTGMYYLQFVAFHDTAYGIRWPGVYPYTLTHGVKIITTGRTYSSIERIAGQLGIVRDAENVISMDVIADMTAGDTAYFATYTCYNPTPIYVEPGPYGGGYYLIYLVTYPYSWFSGYIIE